MHSSEAGMSDDPDGDILVGGDGALADASSHDAALPDVVLVDGGGPFLCGVGGWGCICDGRTHWCEIGAAGPPLDPPPPPPKGWEAGVCGDDSICSPLPSSCLALPSCACLLTSIPLCYCEHSDAGDGLVAGCFLP
jgi:hypothetical protein